MTEDNDVYSTQKGNTFTRATVVFYCLRVTVAMGVK